ncbi:MAG: hypothetical protein HY557_02040 [Euryarchaeota archaeon]|nr:hypothetical protein [Euryarchaeota archaeon]
MPAREWPVAGMVALAMVLPALALPWWTVIGSERLVFVGEILGSAWDFGLFGGAYVVRSTEYSTMPSSAAPIDYEAIEGVRPVLLFVAGLTVLAAALGTMAVMRRIGVRQRGRASPSTALLSIAASTLALFAILYTAVFLPVALEGIPGIPGAVAGFSGSDSWWITRGLRYVISWGPGAGWFLALGAAIVFLADGLFSILVLPRWSWRADGRSILAGGRSGRL